MLDIRGSLVEVVDLSVLLGGASDHSSSGQVVVVVAFPLEPQQQPLDDPTDIVFADEDEILLMKAAADTRPVSSRYPSPDESTIGLLVDSVSDIIFVTHDDIRPPPSLAQDIEHRAMITGLVAKDDRLLAILDPTALLAFKPANGSAGL